MSPLPETLPEELAIEKEKWLLELSFSGDKSAGIGGLRCNGVKTLTKIIRKKK
jgi:hypothetical protein